MARTADFSMLVDGASVPSGDVTEKLTIHCSYEVAGESKQLQVELSYAGITEEKGEWYKNRVIIEQSAAQIDNFTLNLVVNSNDKEIWPN